MADRIWPECIGPSGRGLRIRIYQGAKCVHSETIRCDPHSKADLKSVIKRRDYLLSRKALGLPFRDTVAHDGPMLFDEAAQEYLDLLQCTDQHHKNYISTLNYYWLPNFKNSLCHEITDVMIKRVLQTHVKLSWKTKRNILSPLIGVLDHAKIEPNPARKITIKKGQKAGINRYTPKERDKVLSKLKGPAKAYYTIAFGCGLRAPSEIIALTWDRWDGEHLLIDRAIVRGKLKDTKTCQRRRVYAPTWARAAINALPSRFKGEWMFPAAHGGHLHDDSTIQKRWKEAHKKARVPYRNPYTCRHTRAAELLSSGSNRYAEMAAQMGHSLQMFLSVYSELIEEYTQKDNSIFEGVSGPLKTIKTEK